MMQTLGGYEFVYDPETMTIPESKKDAEVVKTYSGVATFQWTPLIAGQEVVLTWTLMTAAMYAQLRAIYVADGYQTWVPGDGYEYEVLVKDLKGVYNEALFHVKPWRYDIEMTFVIISAAAVTP